MLRFSLLSLPLVILLALAFAGTAAASDRSIERAWDANDAAFTKLGKEYRHAFRAWQDRGYERPRRVLRLSARTRSLLRKNTAAVAAEKSSTDTGASAKRLALRANHLFDRQLRLEARGIRLLTAGKSKAGRRAFGNADGVLKQAVEVVAAARSLFRQVR